MTQKKLLFVGPETESSRELRRVLEQQHPVTEPESYLDLVETLRRVDVAGVVMTKPDVPETGLILGMDGLFDHLPDGCALVDGDQQVLWHNRQFEELVAVAQGTTKGEGDLEHRGSDGCESEAVPFRGNFYEVFGEVEMIGPDFCPFNAALGTGDLGRTLMRVGEKTYFDVRVKPVSPLEAPTVDDVIAENGPTAEQETDADVDPASLLTMATVRDVTAETLAEQKRSAIDLAGTELRDLSPDEVFEMSIEERKELLKARIEFYIADILKFETAEIRLLDPQTELLETLISTGMVEAAQTRELYARPTDNGVTGYVASTGNSYLCKDISTDRLYLPGAPGARSSVTVPIVLHEEILGTFNVESPQPNAFDQEDLRFLEMFAKEVAVALNALELLVVEKATTASESANRILLEVVGPVDEILNESAWILERYIGHEPDVCERLQRILKNTREIKKIIQRVGEDLPTPVQLGPTMDRSRISKLRGKRILVADADETVRQAAHDLLCRYGCDVETAHHGQEAFLMVRSFDYDVVLADIRLPDMNGYECFAKLKDIHEHLPVILMTGFGYDPTHSIVKARQEGLKSVLYKPFRLDQLLTALEEAVSSPADLASGSPPS